MSAAGDLAALAWLDSRIGVNRVRSILRNPRRLIPWLLIMGWLALTFGGRAMLGGNGGGRPQAPPGLGDIVSVLALLAPGALLLVLGLSLFRGRVRPPAAFSSPADARFVIGTGMDARTVLAWICIRAARRVVLMAVFYLLVFGFLYRRLLGVDTGQAVIGAAGLAAFAALVFAARLVVFSGGRRVPFDAGQVAGTPLLALGLAALLVAATRVVPGAPAVPDSILRAATNLPPGSWVVWAFQGDGGGVLRLAVLAACLGAVGLALGDDCHPELWSASTRLFSVRRLLRQGGGLAAYGRIRKELRDPGERAIAPLRRASESGSDLLGGAWVVAWKEWLALRRSTGGLSLQALILAAATAAGPLLHFSTRHLRHDAELGFAVEIVGLFLLFTGFSSIRMGSDLRNPLWWLTSSSLAARLTAWSLARGLRFALPAAAFLLSFFFARQDLSPLLLGLPVLVLLLAWLVQLIGLVAYSVFPAGTDRRLTQMVRMITLYVGLIPVGIALIPGAVVHSLPIALLGVGVMVAAEVAGMINLASWRIQSNGIAYAREEAQ